MKIYSNNYAQKQRAGLVTILNVVIIGGFMLGIMAIAYRASLRSLEGQQKVQLQLDYEAREQAFIRSVVTLAPLYAANTMIDGSNTNGSTKFSDMYATAAAWAHIAEARTAAENTALGFSTYKNGNVGDSSDPDNLVVSDFIGGLNGADAGVTPSGVGAAAATGDPLPLNARVASAATSATIAPLISSDVSYDSVSNTGDDRDFSFLNYPDIHFGYTSGQFIARQNWWKLHLHASSKDIGLTKVGNVDAAGNAVLDSNEYILSIYEVPSQLAISSSAITNLGEISGTAYGTNIDIDGTVFAKEAVVTDGSFDGLATSAGATLSGSASVNGVDGTGSREAYEAANTAAYYPISQASDYARSLFLPINPGLEFFDAFATTDTDQLAGNRLSKESWNNYTRGCHQCKMKMTILETAGGVTTDQTPVAFSFTYINSSDVETTIIVHKAVGSSYSGGVEWLEDDTFPFVSSVSLNGNPSIDIYMARLVTWLQSLDAGIDLSVNHSLVVNVDYNQASVVQPSTPLAGTDIAIGLQECDDFTDFGRGFSLVTNLKLYILDDFNQVATGVADPEYPPVSVFAPEIRYGDNKVSVDGQLATLSQSASGVNPLELKAGGSEAAVAANITANLTSLKSLNELPPVNLMNWLVVVQKK